MIFDIYKQNQGKYTRLGSAVGAAIIVGLGCLQLYWKLQATDFSLWTEIMVPAVVFCALGFSVFWLVNRPTVADFMISAEGEMKKVSWSSRQEIAVSTFIVIIVVFIMAILLGVTDFIFQLMFLWLFGK